MSKARRQEKALEAALHTGAANEDTRPLVDTATRLKKDLAIDVPPADRQRALFLSGVAARQRSIFSPARVLVPALAIAVIIFAGFAGQNAVPGQRLYPVREALNSVGIGESPLEEIEDQLWLATRLVREAEASLERNPGKALRLAVEAVESLGPARALVPDLDGQRAAKLHQIEALEDRAVNVIVEASSPSDDEDDDSGAGSDDPGEGGDDNSGPGSDDSGTDDNSGSGSDDSASDNSGSGSDDSGSDDSSGSGSDDSGSDDSGSDGSGSDDSSGSDSGSDDTESDDRSGSDSDDPDGLDDD